MKRLGFGLVVGLGLVVAAVTGACGLGRSRRGRDIGRRPRAPHDLASTGLAGGMPGPNASPSNLTIRGVAIAAVLALACSVLVAPVAAQTCTHFASNAGGGTGLTQGSPFQISNFMALAAPGLTLCLLDGTYTGANSMVVTSNVNGAPGSPITVRALNDGAVVINGQGVRSTLHVSGTASYWSFIGFDVTNSTGPTALGDDSNTNGGASVVDVAWPGPHTDLTFKRICAYNQNPRFNGTGGIYWTNQHVWSVAGTARSLFEDICGFGSGRTAITEFENWRQDGPGNGNTYRRAWFRHEGHPMASYLSGQCAGGVIQSGYYTMGRNIWENIIEIHDYGQVVVGPLVSGVAGTGWGGCSVGAGVTPVLVDATVTSGPAPWTNPQTHGFIPISNNRDPAFEGTGPGDKWFGRVLWMSGGYLGNKQPLNFGALYMKTGVVSGEPTTAEDQYNDVFIDARNQPIPPLLTGCVRSNCLNRITAVKSATLHAKGNHEDGTCASNPTTGCYQYRDNNSRINPGTFTNFNEGTDPASLPNFYTGTFGAAQGARNCYQYQNGVLQDGTAGTTATPLWPWPMDARVKLALSRAQAMSMGGAALAGTAGPGYAAATVTSEIVSRYGAIPSQCLVGGSGVPQPPINLIVHGLLLLGLAALAAELVRRAMAGTGT